MYAYTVSCKWTNGCDVNEWSILHHVQKYLVKSIFLFVKILLKSILKIQDKILSCIFKIKILSSQH